MTFTRAWLNALEHMPRSQAIVGGIGASLLGTGVCYVAFNRGHKLPKTTSPEWVALTGEYLKHNNADPIYRPKK